MTAPLRKGQRHHRPGPDDTCQEQTVAASAPASPNPGDMWFDSTNEVIAIYVNSTITWLDVSSA